jgi:hypothetical protein
MSHWLRSLAEFPCKNLGSELVTFQSKRRKAMAMGNKESYENRLWSLLDQGRSKRITHLSADLLGKLEIDLSSKKILFSDAEYRDPLFRKALLELLLRNGTVLCYPDEVTDLVRRIIGSGRVLNLYSGLGEFVFRIGTGLGIEPNELTARWSKLLLTMAAVDALILTEDPRRWRSKEKFDRIICVPPFGHRKDHTEIFDRVISLLADNGRVALLVHQDFLASAGLKWFRQLVPATHQVSGVISLPTRAATNRRGEHALVIISGLAKGTTYMAKSGSLADLSAIGEDYQAWLDGRRISVGFEATLSVERWDVAHYEPVDFRLGEVSSPYRVLRLEEVASVSLGARSPEAKIAINKTGSKALWLDQESDLIEKNNFFLEPKGAVNPMYLYLYLSSSVGREALGKLIKGSTIPYVTLKDLHLLRVVLPEISRQSQIVADALEIKKTTNALEALVLEGKQLLSDKFFELETGRDKFRNFSNQTDKAFYQTLPFPIAIVYRKVANAANHTQRFSLLIELFEVVIRFIVLAQIADYFNGPLQAEVLAKVPELSRLSRPSLGNWVSLFRSLPEFATDSAPFLREIKTLKVNEYQETIKEFVHLRNESFKGHGATLTEGEYEQKFLEHAQAIYDLVAKMAFLASYRLVKTGPMDKDGDFYRVSTQVLMGDNPVFETQVILSRTPMDTQKVVYLNAALEPLVLDPYIILEPCTECHRPELLLFDKFSDKKITYLGYESGHKPTYANIAKLPLALRDAALRHS